MNVRVFLTATLAVCSAIFLPAVGQKNYYVVVGAFSSEEQVKEFTTHVPSFNADTTYAVGNQQNTLHLYVLKTTDRDVALSKTQLLQQSLDAERTPAIGDYESVTISNVEGQRVSVSKNTSNAQPIVDHSNADAAGSKPSSEGAAMGKAPAKPKGKLFKFTIAAEGTSLPGQVHYVDFGRERDMATYVTNEYMDILSPGTDREMALVCGVFGYKQVEKYIDYSNPSSIDGAYQDENGAWVIPYELKRLEKGDVSVMYNVGFYKDAVVMLPHSQTDLDELLNMMKSNPNYEIKVHGHCNGKHDRKITAMGSEQKFFDINGSQHVEGSAKELAALRAESVKLYLMQNGIAEKRIRTYAWGGRYMLVDENSMNAKLNDRIEIEVLKD